MRRARAVAGWILVLGFSSFWPGFWPGLLPNLLPNLLPTPAAHAAGVTRSDMTGCWLSKDFDATSLLADSSDPASARLLHEKMLLRFEPIEGTDHLVFGHIFEWDRDESYVLGPTYENGAFDPVVRTLTFGFPEGGLDTAYLLDEATLLYVHKKSSDKSAMSVRPLKRIDCAEAATLRGELLERQAKLKAKTRGPGSSGER